MSKPDHLDIIQSPSAVRFLQMVTKDFYNRSFIGLWMYEVMGRENDETADVTEQLKYEIFPQTCTWTIYIWEWVYGFEPDDSMSLYDRRERIMERRRERLPINPARIELILSMIIGVPVTITENIAPYTFRVTLHGRLENPITIMVRRLRQIKPSHLSFEMVNEHLPVSVINYNAFIFRELAMYFILASQLTYEDMRFIEFEAKMRFENRGSIARDVRLDGEFDLSGEFLLGATRHYILRGMMAQQLDMGVYTIPNKFSLSATLTRDREWWLDGEFSLDGTQFLDNFIIQEEL